MLHSQSCYHVELSALWGLSILFVHAKAYVFLVYDLSTAKCLFWLGRCVTQHCCERPPLASDTQHALQLSHVAVSDCCGSVAGVFVCRCIRAPVHVCARLCVCVWLVSVKHQGSSAFVAACGCLWLLARARLCCLGCHVFGKPSPQDDVTSCYKEQLTR